MKKQRIVFDVPSEERAPVGTDVLAQLAGLEEASRKERASIESLRAIIREEIDRLVSKRKR